jgi:protein-S-isoprenylcysteine O-methyltransferase Ste14
MARLIVALLLLVYVGTGIASAYLPDSQMPWLVAVASAVLVLAAAVGIVAQMRNGPEG